MTRASSKLASGIITASRARKPFVEIAYSKFVLTILDKLLQKNLISFYKFSVSRANRVIVGLKYSSSGHSFLSYLVFYRRVGISQYLTLRELKSKFSSDLVLVNTVVGVVWVEEAIELELGGELILKL